MLRCLRYRKILQHMKKTEKQQNALKGVMLPFEKFGCLRNLPVDEAGEIIQTVLAYGMDGTKPEFKDKYQQRYYESFLAPITEQIANAEKRAVQCREAAQQRADALKAAKKIIAMQEREAKSAKKNGATDSTATPTLFDNAHDNTGSPNESPEVVQDQTDTNNDNPLSNDTVRNATSAVSPTVLQENTGCNTLPEDLSYSYLLSLGIKRDTGPYNGETTWNAMSDDEKRAAIAYVKQNITNNASKRNTLYASKFLGSNVWKTKA